MNKKQQAKLLAEIMEADQRDGLYEQPKPQTAIEHLLSNLPERFKNAMLNSCKDLIEKSKQMEKEQLNEACYDGYYREDLYDTRKYYDDTYGKK